MKKILELFFCLVALIALLISTKYSENVDNVKNESVVAASSVDSQETSLNEPSVAMLENQK